ncbi:hypothetical protein IB234_23360 [Pseudomonas sp. PDM16]|uniref:hypothetical protein n=1 Tax=Pseudomonas sp. PDM16 TaxID=2769292 RepID=UPI00177DFCED|nr:hypothetical protein [Pseudomonas sp. PDM16]MBD9417514.1 hypothetical protein [Pseudomonas sp. PDM16]
MPFMQQPASASGAEIWSDAPQFPSWADPSFYSDSGDLYMCFEAHTEETFTTVRFEGLIEMSIQPFTEENLGSHEFYKFGLKQYEFNILKNSSKISYWKALNPTHWVITFQDRTIDVIAKECVIIAKAIPAKSQSEALLAALK